MKTKAFLIDPVKDEKNLRLIVHINEWPWGVDTTMISDDGLCSVSIGDECGYAVIHNLIVHETVRKQGRGRLLLKAAENYGEKVLHRLNSTLRVVPGTWMEQWYRRNGYVDFNNPPCKADGYIDLIKNL